MMRYLTCLKLALFIIFFVTLTSALIVFVSADQNAQQEQHEPVIKSPSLVGDVAFPHELHFDDLEIECKTCHHEINAEKLIMPHEDYFDDFWIDCQICHRSDGSATPQAQSCSNCHHESPTDIADETLSTKVVIHKNCWGCHEVEKGATGSQSCQICHNSISASVNVP